MQTTVTTCDICGKLMNEEQPHVREHVFRHEAGVPIGIQIKWDGITDDVMDICNECRDKAICEVAESIKFF